MDVTKTNRDINNLSDNFKLKVIDFLTEVGNDIFITEGFRSAERQEYLYSKGRTIEGPKVTWVEYSNHQDGIAIDIAFRGVTLYPTDFFKWRKIADIAIKYGIDWSYDLWNGIEKAHFQDNGVAYIPKKKKMEQYGELITINGFVYPSSIYGIPVRLAKTNSTTLMGKAKVKGYLEGVIKDEILIFENTFKYGIDYLYKVINHEFSHFIYHRHLDSKEDNGMIFNDGKSFWEKLSIYIPSYISTYAATQPAEDFAELIGYSHYIKSKIDLPDSKLFNDPVKFKYEIAIKLYLAGLKKHKESLQDNIT